MQPSSLRQHSLLPCRAPLFLSSGNGAFALRIADVSGIACIAWPIVTDSIDQTLLAMCCRGVAIHRTYSFQIHEL